MADFGVNDKLTIDDRVDEQGEVEVAMPFDYGDGGGEVCTWLNKEQAEAVIDHLQSLFGI